MADTVDTLALYSGTKRRAYRFTNVCDGTGESAVVKIDKSTLTGPNGSEPTSLVVEEIQWSIQGFTSVRLFWDHASDDEISVLGTGNGYFNFCETNGLVDPGSGGTGDIILTTAGNTSGSTYDISIVVRLKD